MKPPGWEPFREWTALLRKRRTDGLFRPFSPNMHDHSPQMTKKSRSAGHPLATDTVLGQTPGKPYPNSLIADLRKQLIRPVGDAAQHTASLLHTLLDEAHWPARQRDIIDQLSRRLEISGQLRSHYVLEQGTLKWRADATVLAEPWCSLAVLQLYRATRMDRQREAPSGKRLKRFNALFKLLPAAKQAWADQHSALQQAIIDDFQQLQNAQAASIAAATPGQPASRPPQPTAPQARTRTLPISVLFYEGPIARAYLETLHAAGLRPERIIQLVSSRDLSTGKPLGRLLPVMLRQHYAASIQSNRIHHWPKRIAAQHPELRSAIHAEVTQQLGFAQALLEDASAPKPLQHYCDDVTPLLITGLKDPRLQQYLATLPPATLLFTGGGMVPTSLLDIKGLRFIHIHPGYLPDIRGADCVLWSALLHGQCSASSFYLSAGIDTGDIIQRAWLPPLKFPLDPANYAPKTLYRAIYAFFDPWVRASLLQQTLSVGGQLDRLSTLKQAPLQGTNYHFMQEQLQQAALKVLFDPARPNQSGGG